MVTRLSFLKTAAASKSREARSVPLVDSEHLAYVLEATHTGR